MFAISLLAAVLSACPYVPAVRHRAWGAVRSFGVALFAFGVAAVVLLILFARLFREAA
jgi:hypothetical protein